MRFRMKTRHFNLLIVDDEKNVRRAMQRSFARTPYHLLFADHGEAALQVLSKQPVTAMLLDLKMPGMDGLTVLQHVMKAHPHLKVIMLTGHGGVREAVAAMKLGAIDFFQKSISPSILKNKVAQLYEIWRLEHENLQLRERLETRFQFHGLIGETPPMLKLKDMIARIAATDTSVLIQGESGSGKELIAQAIHQHSTRKDMVFIPVDCATINETVMESELFGHARGAFTGADQATLGLIRSANKGTLFLDEVSELSLTMQAKFLRTLQERVVRPVGAINAIPVDIRIVAATNRNLIDAIAEGHFRQDLYYRLSAVTLHAPPLRERHQDLPLLCRHFIECLQREGLSLKRFSSQAMMKLKAYQWPGNVRELENVIRGAMAFSDGDVIAAEDISIAAPSACNPSQPPAAEPVKIADYEAAAIRDALAQNDGNRRETAKMLGISEATLYRRLKQYNL